MRKVENCIVVSAILVGLALGYSKVTHIRKDLANIGYAQGEHVFEGYLCIDGYCYYANEISLFLSRDNSWEDVREYIAVSNHPSSFLGPLLISVLNQTVRTIPASYMAISALSMLLVILIVYRILKYDLKEDRVAPVALLLLILHNHVLLGFTNLYQGPVVMLFVCLAIFQTTRVLKLGGAKETVLLILILSSGLFTKVSFLPILAVPVFALWIYKYHRPIVPFHILKPVFLFIGIPLTIFGIFYGLIPGFESLISEQATIRNHWGTGVSLKDFCFEMAVLFQLFVFLWIPNKKIFKDPTYIVCFLTMCLYFVGIASHYLPTAYRLYLPIVPAIIILSVPGLKSMYHKNVKWSLILTFVLCVSNIALSIYSIKS